MVAAGPGLLTARSARAATPFTMQAAWVNDAEFMGYFIAIDKGWYAEEGLELEYLSGGPDVIPESSLLSNKAPLALTTPFRPSSAVTSSTAGATPGRIRAWASSAVSCGSISSSLAAESPPGLT